MAEVQPQKITFQVWSSVSTFTFQPYLKEYFKSTMKWHLSGWSFWWRRKKVQVAKFVMLPIWWKLERILNKEWERNTLGESPFCNSFLRPPTLWRRPGSTDTADITESPVLRDLQSNGGPSHKWTFLQPTREKGLWSDPVHSLDV